MYMGMGLCLGIVFGTALDNLALGIAIGVAVGAGIDSSRSSKWKKIKISDDTTSSLLTCPLREEKSFSQRAFAYLFKILLYNNVYKWLSRHKTKLQF